MTSPVEPTGFGALRGRVRAGLERRRSRRALDRVNRPDRPLLAPRDATTGSTRAERGATDVTAAEHAPDHRGGRRRTAARVGAALTAIAAIALLFLGPGSVGIWLDQRRETARLQDKIDTLNEANEALDRRAEDLKDPDTIAEIARRSYGMVPRGAKAYAIMPSEDTAGRLGGTWPFVDLARVVPVEPEASTTTAP